MAEVGVDISGHSAKTVADLPTLDFDCVVTLCDHAHESCPYFPGRIVHRGFPDPPRLAEQATDEDGILRAYRTVRDQIRAFILSLPAALQAGNPEQS